MNRLQSTTPQAHERLMPPVHTEARATIRMGYENREELGGSDTNGVAFMLVLLAATYYAGYLTPPW